MLANNSFKPSPLRGLGHTGPHRAGRLNSGVRRGEKQFALMLLVVSHFFTASRLIDFALDRWLRGGPGWRRLLLRLQEL